MFREICTFIAARSGFVIGSTLQTGRHAQNAPVRCVLVSESGGMPYFYPNTDMADLTIQVLSRAEKYFDARADIYAVHNAIHGTSGWNLPRLDGASGEDYLAMTIEALAVPQYLGEDDNRRHLFSANYIFRMEEGSCTEHESGA